MRRSIVFTLSHYIDTINAQRMVDNEAYRFCAIDDFYDAC
jgi:hypothetical protein